MLSQRTTKVAGTLTPPLDADCHDQLAQQGGVAVLPPGAQHARIDVERAAGDRQEGGRIEPSPLEPGAPPEEIDMDMRHQA